MELAGLEPATSCLRSARTFAPVRARSLKPPVCRVLPRRPNAVRTRANAERCHCCHAPTRRTPRRASRRAARGRVGQARVHSRGDARVRVARERGGLGQREPGRERDRDERVAEVVDADRLAAVAVQPRGVTGRVDGAEHVAAAVRLPARRREHERVRLDAGERLGPRRGSGARGARRRARGRSGHGRGATRRVLSGTRAPSGPSCALTVSVPALRSTSRQRRPSASESRRPA